MKTRIALSTLLVLSSTYACGGKVIIDEPGEGGAGGAPSTVDVGPGPVTGGISVSVSATSSVGTGPMTTGTGVPPCMTCAQAISGELGGLCPGSNDLYNALIACVCSTTCAPVCGSNLCQGGEAPDQCLKCINDNNMGCGKEFTACVSDL